MNDIIILALMLAGPRHGYQIKREAGVLFGHQELHNNLVYPALRRFLNNKWVSQRAVPGQRGQTRNQYALTTAGRKALVAQLSRFGADQASSGHAFRVRVRLLPMLSHEVREHILTAREAFLRARIATLAKVDAAFAMNWYASAVTGYLKRDAETEIAWISTLRKHEEAPKG